MTVGRTYRSSVVVPLVTDNCTETVPLISPNENRPSEFLSYFSISVRNLIPSVIVLRSTYTDYEIKIGTLAKCS